MIRGDKAQRRIEIVARRTAKLVLDLKRQGEIDAAQKLEQAGIEACELIRKGAL